MTQDKMALLIIGSGPAGLTAAIYAARANLKPLVIGGIEPGGQLMLTTEVDNFPGFPEGIMGPELMTRMRAQAERFGATFLDQNVDKVDFSQQPLRIMVGQDTFSTQSVIIATGATALWLGLENETRLRGRGVLQEIWGHLCCHYAIRTLMAGAAEHSGHDPDRISFVAALGDHPPVRRPPGRFFPLMTTTQAVLYG